MAIEKINPAELNEKQRAFCREYIKDFNGTQAATRAGYSKKTARSQGQRLLTNVDIQAEIKRLTSVEEDIAVISLNTLRKNLMMIADRCMQAVPVLEKVDGEWVETGEFRFDSAGACRALELLGKTISAFTDKTEHSGPGGKPLSVVFTMDIGKPSADEA